MNVKEQLNSPPSFYELIFLETNIFFNFDSCFLYLQQTNTYSHM